MNLLNKKISIIGLGYVGLPLAVAFAKKFNVDGTFIKFETDHYYFREKDSFGMVDYKYNKQGKIVRDGEKTRET